MTVHRNGSHAEKVEAWETKNTENLPVELLLLLFENGILAIQRRSLLTLSSITIKVVMDRALCESKEKFPVLYPVQFEQQSLNFELLKRAVNSAQTAEVRLALRFLTVEILCVLGNITAEVLTEHLHQELMAVTLEKVKHLEKLNREES